MGWLASIKQMPDSIKINTPVLPMPALQMQNRVCKKTPMIAQLLLHTCSGRLVASRDLTVEVGGHGKLTSKNQNRHRAPPGPAMLNTEDE